MIEEVSSHKARLDSVFAWVNAQTLDPESLSHWAQYLCVLVAGFLERAVCATYGRYVEARAHPNVVRYAQRSLNSFQNPKMGKILELARQFQVDWAAALEQATTGDLRDAVDSVMGNRHHIAHGIPVPSLTYSRVRDYYRRVIQVVDLVSQQCGF